MLRFADDAILPAVAGKVRQAQVVQERGVHVAVHVLVQRGERQRQRVRAGGELVEVQTGGFGPLAPKPK